MEKSSNTPSEVSPQSTPVPDVAPPQQTKKRGRRLARAVGVLSLVIICVLAGVSGSYIYDKYGTTAITRLDSGYDGNNKVSSEEEDIAAVAEKVSPSVVSVLTTSTPQTGFFGAAQQEGAGTGIIVSSNGYVMTNHHVVKGANNVTVVSADGTTYKNVKVVGSDPLNDVAFLKISGVKKMKPAELGDSKTVRIGQKVVAIGNALGQYQNSVTSGIISGTGRSVQASLDGTADGETEALSDLFQTDAAINAGNSGGPLVNMAGQVIGINTAIASDANSVGFVIPIGSTKGILRSVIDTGKVTRAYIGVRYLTVTADTANTYKLPVKHGAYVYADNTSAVIDGSPADKAGLKRKDVITKVNDVEIGSKGSLSTLVGEYKSGDTIQLTILRDGKTMTKKLSLTAFSR